MFTNQCDIIECDIIEGEICGFGIAAESSVGVSDVRSSILDLLRPLGITERYFGVRQLIQAVEMVMENPDTIHALQKEVYDVIALQYSVSWGAIERNLRIISQRAWDTDPVYIEKLAGYPMSKRPTASQLIEIIEAYEEITARFELYTSLERGLKDIQEGNTRPLSVALSDLRWRRKK